MKKLMMLAAMLAVALVATAPVAMAHSSDPQVVAAETGDRHDRGGRRRNTERLPHVRVGVEHLHDVAGDRRSAVGRSCPQQQVPVEVGVRAQPDGCAGHGPRDGTDDRAGRAVADRIASEHPEVVARPVDQACDGVRRRRAHPSLIVTHPDVPLGERWMT